MTANLLARALVGSPGDDAFADAALLQAMLRFETALAQAQGALGMIPGTAADGIAAHAATLALDADALARDALPAGTLAIPLVQALTAHVRAGDAAASRYVHFGATSQDLLDTAVVLCAQAALARLERMLLRAAQAAAALARTHAAAPALARTLLQPAGVTSVGLRCAQWAAALADARRRVLATAQSALAVALGGAIGNLAAWGGAGSALRAEVARRLGLHDPGATWHTARAPWIALGTDVALAAGAMAKIAHDIALCAMAEIAELAEPDASGRGGSTAMPHKRNPVLCMRVIATVQPIPGIVAGLLHGMQQEQERALGNWQAELSQVPELYRRACAAAGALCELLGGLRVDAPRCAENIEALHGTVFSEALAALLVPAVGRARAQGLVADLCRQALAQRAHLRDLARGAADPAWRALAPADIDAAFDVQRSAAVSARLVAPLLERYPELAG